MNVIIRWSFSCQKVDYHRPQVREGGRIFHEYSYVFPQVCVSCCDCNWMYTLCCDTGLSGAHTCDYVGLCLVRFKDSNLSTLCRCKYWNLCCCDVKQILNLSQSLLSQKKGLFKNKVISLLLVKDCENKKMLSLRYSPPAAWTTIIPGVSDTDANGQLQTRRRLNYW